MIKSYRFWLSLLMLSLAVFLFSQYSPQSPFIPTDTSEPQGYDLVTILSLISSIVSTVGMVYTIRLNRLEIRELEREIRERDEQSS